MSIAVFFLAKTGLVMGTDSRVTFYSKFGVGTEDSYPKLVSFDPLPIGMAMVGAGGYGGRDFRSLVTETIAHHKMIKDRDNSVEEVVKTFVQVATPIAQNSGRSGEMTVMVGGYSPGQFFGEFWEITLPSGDYKCYKRPGENMIGWRGSSDAIKNLWWGIDQSKMEATLNKFEISPENMDQIFKEYKSKVSWGPERLQWSMPLRSAVDLVQFLLNVQINYERFMPGCGKCGEPLQLIAVSPKGLTWVKNPFPW